MGCHFLLQGIFLAQESNPGLLHCRQILYQLTYKGSPFYNPIKFALLDYNIYLLLMSTSLQSLSCVRLFATPQTVACQASPSMGFSRQEYWSGLPFPFPGDLPNPEIKPRSPALQADSLPSEPLPPVRKHPTVTQQRSAHRCPTVRLC